MPAIGRTPQLQIEKQTFIAQHFLDNELKCLIGVDRVIVKVSFYEGHEKQCTHVARSLFV